MPTLGTAQVAVHMTTMILLPMKLPVSTVLTLTGTMWCIKLALQHLKTLHQVLYYTVSLNSILPVLFAHIVEDVRITNITGSSAEITWTVPSLSTTQDYVVEYGEDEDDLDLSTDPITVTDTTLIDQMYTVTLEGLSQSVLYYVRVATTDPEGATFYSETKSFRTIQTGIPQG